MDYIVLYTTFKANRLTGRILMHIMKYSLLNIGATYTCLQKLTVNEKDAVRKTTHFILYGQIRRKETYRGNRRDNFTLIQANLD